MVDYHIFGGFSGVIAGYLYSWTLHG